MKKINFIFLRSPVTSSTEFQDNERKKFLSKLNRKNDFEFTKNGRQIFFIETGGTEEIFKRVFKRYKAPYFIVATNANNSLPAALEIATFLKNKNLKFTLIHGTPDEVRRKLINENNSIKSKENYKFNKTMVLKNKKFGVIGKPSDWLIASQTNYKEVEKKLGAKIIDIPIEKLLQNYSKIKSIKIPQNFKQLLNEKVNEKTLKDALKIYHSLKEIISKQKLDGITVRCFDLLGTLKNTSCLALAMLNSEGIIATCEGDVPAMLSMAIVDSLYSNSSFQVNPSYVNLEKKYAYFAHCTLPLDMCKSYKFDTHFESDIGIGIKGKLKTSKVTIFKINKNLNDFEIFSGKIVSNLKKSNLCRTQIKVRFNQDISSILSNPNGNHLVVFYGDKKRDLINKLS